MELYLSKIKEKDPKGYNLVKTSYLQKMIRRGETGKALALADLYIEMNHQKALDRRLKQIWGEDISAASPFGLVILNSDDYSFDQKIVYLCAVEKNRESDRFLITVDYALETLKDIDKQTWREVAVLKKLLELTEEWFEEKGRKEKKQKKEKFENYFSKLKGEGKLNQVIDLCLDNYFELTKHKVHGARVMIAAAVLISLRSMGKENMPELEIPLREDIDKVPDYVLDIHTPFGKKMGRDVYHWAENGTMVSPEKVYKELFDSKNREKYPLINTLPFLDERKKRYQRD